MDHSQVPSPRNFYLINTYAWTYLAHVSQQRGTNNVFVDRNTMRFHTDATICNVRGYNAPDTVDTHPLNRQCKLVEHSPITELMKIDDVENYNEACKEYEKRMKEGWTEERLLEMIAQIRRRPSKSEGEDEFLA